MHRAIRIVSVALVGIVVLTGSSYASSADDRSDILKVREAVWRAWFANDTKTLHKLVPPDTIVISAGEDKWKTQAEVFQSATDLSKGRWKAHSTGVPADRDSALRGGRNYLEQISGRNGNERETIADFRQGHGGFRAAPRTMDQSGLAH
jgi:hypothetical protein